MTDFKELKDEELDKVSGGVIINNGAKNKNPLYQAQGLMQQSKAGMYQSQAQGTMQQSKAGMFQSQAQGTMQQAKAGMFQSQAQNNKSQN